MILIMHCKRVTVKFAVMNSQPLTSNLLLKKYFTFSCIFMCQKFDVSAVYLLLVAITIQYFHCLFVSFC